jgi:hypothetical protein
MNQTKCHYSWYLQSKLQICAVGPNQPTNSKQTNMKWLEVCKGKAIPVLN